MSYRFSGLGETSEVPRAAWCPTTSLKPGQRDPCEVRYSFDLPLVGKTEFGLPIPAMTNDALLTVQKQLPQVLDESLPVVYQKLAPYLADLKAGTFADLEYFVPELLDDVMKKQILPELERQKDNIIAETEMIRDEALKTALALTGMVVVAMGVGFWWLKGRP
jgi:hypothetical protein